MGSQRIASRVGDGIAAIFEGKSTEMTELKTLQQQDLLNYAKHAGIKTIEYEQYTTPDLKELVEEGDTRIETRISIYYYHPDHLGTNTLITDNGGIQYQLFLNLPFGETMAEQFANPDFTLPYKFNGKELDKETGLYYYGARYYDPRVSLWLGVDPMADARSLVSPYAYCQNNPIVRVDPTGALDSDHIDVFGNVIAHYDDNDKSVYVHKYGTTKAQVDAQRTASNNTGGSGTKIGEIGGNIDVSGIMTNKLNVSSKLARNINGLGEFADWVKAGSVWDLKGNKKTIFGVAWEYDASNNTSTTFNFGDYSNMTAADVGNYHFGYVGRNTNNGLGFSESTLWIAAGLVEIKKNIFNEGRILTGLNGITQLFGIGTPKPPFGDRMEDFIWSTMGMIDADKSKKR